MQRNVKTDHRVFYFELYRNLCYKEENMTGIKIC